MIMLSPNSQWPAPDHFTMLQISTEKAKLVSVSIFEAEPRFYFIEIVTDENND